VKPCNWNLSISERGKFFIYGGCFFLAWGISLQNIHLSILGLFIITFSLVCLIPHFLNRRKIKVHLKYDGLIHVNEVIYCKCYLQNTGRINRFSFSINHNDDKEDLSEIAMLAKANESIALEMRPLKRCSSQKSPLKLLSLFPFGIFQSHSEIYWDKIQNILPARVKIKNELRNDLNEFSAGDEFFYLREYIPGDSLKSIDWKSSACNKRGLRTKVFKSNIADKELNLIFTSPIKCDQQSFEFSLSILNELVKKHLDRGVVVYLRSPYLKNDFIKMNKTPSEEFYTFIASTQLQSFSEDIISDNLLNLKLLGIGPKQKNYLPTQAPSTYIDLLSLKFQKANK